MFYQLTTTGDTPNPEKLLAEIEASGWFVADHKYAIEELTRFATTGTVSSTLAEVFWFARLPGTDPYRGLFFSSEGAGEIGNEPFFYNLITLVEIYPNFLKDLGVELEVSWSREGPAATYK